MNGNRMRLSALRVVRGKGFFLALAAAALALLILKPMCDIHTSFAGDTHEHAFAAHAQSGVDPAPCCQTVDAGGIAKMADTAAIGWSGKSPELVAIVLFVIGAISISRRGAIPSPGAPPGPHSYYARSARILR